MNFNRYNNSKKSFKGAGLKIKIVAFLTIFLTAFMFFVLNEIFAVFKFSSVEKIVAIPENSSKKTICAILKKNKIVSSGFILRAYIKITKFTNFKSGKFKLRENMSYGEILKVLSDSSNGMNGEKIVFIDGMNFFSLKEKYNNKLSINVNDVIDEINKKENYSKFDFIKLLDAEKLKKAYFPMEGLIFPATVNIYENTTPKHIAEKLLDISNTKIIQLKEKIKDSRMSLWDIFTLSSIIQAETSNFDDMPKVSGVFHNRLKINKNLQSDVTVLYSKKIKKDMEQKGLNLNAQRIDSYNTYTIKGLSNGPICIPTYEAINAALNPKIEDYYYFYSSLKKGKILYAKDYEGHKKNIEEDRYKF